MPFEILGQEAKKFVALHCLSKDGQWKLGWGKGLHEPGCFLILALHWFCILFAWIFGKMIELAQASWFVQLALGPFLSCLRLNFAFRFVDVDMHLPPADNNIAMEILPFPIRLTSTNAWIPSTFLCNGLNPLILQLELAWYSQDVARFHFFLRFRIALPEKWQLPKRQNRLSSIFQASCFRGYVTVLGSV